MARCCAVREKRGGEIGCLSDILKLSRIVVDGFKDKIGFIAPKTFSDEPHSFALEMENVPITPSMMTK
jgi:hypothetical protein